MNGIASGSLVWVIHEGEEAIIIKKMNCIEDHSIADRD